VVTIVAKASLKAVLAPTFKRLPVTTFPILTPPVVTRPPVVMLCVVTFPIAVICAKFPVGRDAVEVTLLILPVESTVMTGMLVAVPYTPAVVAPAMFESKSPDPKKFGATTFPIEMMVVGVPSCTKKLFPTLNVFEGFRFDIPTFEEFVVRTVVV
jgi:hypothetical protein